MTELIITEKPSQSQKIAEALSDKKPKKKIIDKVPYYEIEHNKKKILIGCAVGHLFNLTEREKSYKYPTFDLIWKPSSEISKNSAFSKKYLNVLKKLAKESDEYTVSCDFDLEGSLIGWNIIRFVCEKKDANRMKFSTLTKKELIESYNKKSKHLDFPLINSGEARHTLDYYWGINLSRALTLAVKNAGMFKILSSGRVQGPALKILAERELEIQKFKPEQFWELEAVNSITLNHKKGRFFDRNEVNRIYEKIKNEKTATVIDLTKKEFYQEAPTPFDLTSLQLESYRVFGITPKETLSIAQELYTNAYISYPRTSSNQIPESLDYKEIISGIGKQKQYEILAKKLLSKKELKPNNGKKTDPAHPPIIPTEEIPKKLSDREKKIYDLIVKRTLATFADKSKRETITINTKIKKEPFLSKGTRTIEKGWHLFYEPYLKLEELEMPNLKKNDKINLKKINKLEKETTPPRRFSEASIIKELESKSLGTKSISGNTLTYINGKWIAIRDLFNIGENTKEKLLVKIPLTTFYDLNKKKINIKKDVLVAKRFKQKNEDIFSIQTQFTNIISDSNHKYFLVDDKIIYEKQAKGIIAGEKLLFTRLNSFGSELITMNWLDSIKRKYNIQIKNNNLYYQNGKGFNIDSLPILESSKLFWLLGYIYGDGSVNKRAEYEGYGIGITIDKNEGFLISKITKTLEDLFGKNCYGITVPSNRGVIRIDVPSVISYYLVKRFPSLVNKSPFEISKEYRGDFVKGYMDSDGNIHLRGKGQVLIKGTKSFSNNTPRIKFVLSRENHIKWIKEILNSFEIVTSNIKFKIAKIKNKEYKCYELKISGKNNILLYAINIGFEHPKKRNMLYKGLLNSSSQYEPIIKLTKCFLELLKNNNEFTKFDDNITYILKNYEQLKIIERRRVCKGYSRKYAVRIPGNVITKIINFFLPIYGEEFLPWNYAVKIEESKKINYNEEDFYDLIVDKENPTFITFGGQIIHNSTRASIIEALYNRDYIKEKSIEVTDLGIKTIDVLKKYSPEIIDENLTRHFEEEMEQIREEKIKKEEVIDEAVTELTKILKKFKQQEKNIGAELIEALKETREKASVVGKCPNCKEGDLRILYSKRFKSYFVACSKYPDCKTTFSLTKGLPKPTEKLCPTCNYPLVLIIRQGTRPFDYCFNKLCEKRLEWMKENKAKIEEFKKNNANNIK